MLLISLGLHGLLLLIPMPTQPLLQSQEPEPQPEETIKISDLLIPPSKPSPKPSSKPSPKASKLTSKKAAPIPRQQAVSLPSASKPQPNPVSTGSPTSEASSTPQASPEATSTPDAEASDEEFQNLFGKVEGEVDEKLIDPNLFERPESFYTEESLSAGGKPARKSEIDKIKWISLKTPDVVLDELKPQLKGINVEPTTQGEYGGGTVYQIKKGSSVRYINLVPTKGSIGTIVIVWSRDPNLSPK